MGLEAISDSLRRYGRLLLSRFGPHRIELIFHKDYIPPINGFYDQDRGLKIISYLLDEGFLGPKQILAPEIPTVRDEQGPIERFHSAAYLKSHSDQAAVEAVFEQSLSTTQSETLLAMQRAMSLGTVMGVKRAVEAGWGGSVCVNLGGGFHHALRERGGLNCLFNDLAIGVHELRREGWGGRVLIIDLDLHQGAGTRRIFASDSKVMTVSVHARDRDSEAIEDDVNIALGPGIGDQAYRRCLTETLPGVFDRFDPELVLYVAGVDIADDDTLGNWRISPDTILWRDQFICELVDSRPLVWTLGGGYGPNAWRYTARSLAWMSTGLDDPISSDLEVAMERGRKISQELDPNELTGASEEGELLTEADLYGDLMGKRTGERLFHFYSLEGIEKGLERYGVLEHLRGLGYDKTKAEMTPHHSGGQLLRLYSDDGQRDLLIEAVLKEELSFSPYRLLSVEWLLMQNPRAKTERSLLPGQKYPGLGCLNKIVLMLTMICERLNFDGLTFYPSHFHIAAFARGLLAFLDPKFEARFLAMEQALERVPLLKATWLADQGKLVHAESGEAVKWTSEAMVFAVSEDLAGFLKSADYEQAVEEAMPDFNYLLSQDDSEIG